MSTFGAFGESYTLKQLRRRFEHPHRERLRRRLRWLFCVGINPERRHHLAYWGVCPDGTIEPWPVTAARILETIRTRHERPRP